MANFINKNIKSIVKFVAMSLLFVAVGYTISFYVDHFKKSVSVSYEAEISELLKGGEDFEGKLESIKNQVVEDLAVKCEVLGVPKGKRNGQIVFDTNDEYSLGKWQFQIATVKHYYGVFFNQKITTDEAVLIAHTEEKARELAYKIIWEEVGGIWNWRNCEKKLGLAQKIEIVRELEK